MSCFFHFFLFSRTLQHQSAAAMNQERATVRNDVKRESTAQLHSIKKVIDQFPFFFSSLYLQFNFLRIVVYKICISIYKNACNTFMLLN